MMKSTIVREFSDKYWSHANLKSIDVEQAYARLYRHVEAGRSPPSPSAASHAARNG
jgi:hypothetical protein